MDRFQILLSSGVIREETFTRTEKVRTILADQTGPGDTLEMVLTHYAMALERQCRKEEVPAPDEHILLELTQDPRYPAACGLLDRIQAVSQPALPDAEQQLMLVHLINLISA